MKTNCLRKLAFLAGAVLTAAAVVSTAKADYISTMQGLNGGLGPVAWWRLQDSTATAPLFVVTNAGSLGSAANGNVVQNLANTPSLGQPGLIGTCAQFFNTGNTVGLAPSKIEVPWQAGMNQNPPFTVEFWVKPNSLGSDSTGFSPLENFNPAGNGGGSRRGWLFYLNNGGRWNFRLGAYSGYTVNLLGTGGNAVAGTWQHIAVTWNGTTVTMYANGAVIGSAASSFPADGWVPNAVSFLRMGGSPLTGTGAEANANASTSTIGNRGFDGWLQHVAVYTSVLSPATITDHYNTGLLGNSATYQAHVQLSNPVGYWTLNDATASTPATSMVASTGIDTGATGTVHPGVQVQSGPGYTGFGSDANGLFFDGVNGYIQVNDTPDLKSGSITNTITLTAWVKPQAQDFYRDIIARGFDQFDDETFLRISHGPLYSGPLQVANTGDQSGDDVQYYEVGTTDGNNYYDSAQFQIPPGDIGNWVFLAGTCDGANWKMYRNGQLVATVPMDSTDGDIGPVLPLQQWTIGSRAPDTINAGQLDIYFAGQGEFFDGTIFEPAIFTNALSSTDINNLYLAALAPPQFTVKPVNPGTVATHNNLTFTALAEGYPTIGYLWYLNGVDTHNVTTSFSINNILAGNYAVAVVATNLYGKITNSISFMAVSLPPTVTTPPMAQTRYVGYPFTLSVAASGSLPLTYFWTQNGNVVQAGASSSYTVASPTTGNGGSYSVIVSNEAGVAFNYTTAPVVVSILSLPSASSYPGQVLASSPQSYWRLDEAPGSPTAFDIISGNNGTYNNANLGQPGYSVLDPDTAAAFSGVNSYVGNISGTAINFVNNAEFTLEAWVNGPPGLLDQSSIIAKGIGNNGTTETEQFVLDVSQGSYRFFTSQLGNVYQTLAQHGPDGTWQHVVGVFDDSTIGSLGYPTLRIYVNGVQEGTVLAELTQNPTMSPVSIGSKRTGNDPKYDGTFGGTIDEVAVYPSALGASTIQAHYNAAYGTSLAPVIGVEPVSATNYAGLPVSLNVVAWGSATVNFQWYKGSPPGGTPVGNNSPTYSIGTVAATDAGNYYCHITNPVLPAGTNTAVVGIGVVPTPNSPPSISGLVVHLPLNGNLTDSTGRGNNGTGMHAVNPYAFPINNSAVASNAVSITPLAPSPATAPDFYYSDGPPGLGGLALHYSTIATNSGGLSTSGISTGTNDYYVSLGLRPDLEYLSSNVSFSVSYWLRLPLGYGTTAPNGGDLPYFCDVTNSTGGQGYTFATAYGYGTEAPQPNPPPVYNQVGTWGASIYDGAAIGVRYYGDNYQAINDGFYHNLVHVVDHSTGKFTTYIDGVPAIQYLIAGISLNNMGSIDNGAAAVIGQDPTGLYGEDGHADIADLGVWRKALSPLEAASIFVAGTNGYSFTGTGPGPVSILLGAVSKSGNSVTLNWAAQPPLTGYSFTVWGSGALSGPYTMIATGIAGSGTGTGTYTDNGAGASGTQNFYRVTSP